eukprot:TRINITY_DN23450_c0_g1_i2.p1 TRINITY_DN23450_c0_g1~~TRINITY_DN23450_c0_g1_i2.p1  ORF type:complete len:105 (-),score=21.78 TRINITY_DN23450_c0_g1_i2:232-546(-)
MIYMFVVMMRFMGEDVVVFFFFFFQAEDGIRDAQESRGLGDVYKRQVQIIRRFVIMREPRSPLFPLVSSIPSMASMMTSPRRTRTPSAFSSNRISRSCHTYKPV